MTEPLVSRRRIDGLKDIAYGCNLTNEEARTFGKLSKTSTWEALLNFHNLEYDSKPTEISDSIIATTSQENPHQINFFEWVDFGQLLTLTLAGVGLFALLLSLWPRTLNFIPLPVKITIQIGAK